MTTWWWSSPWWPPVPDRDGRHDLGGLDLMVVSLVAGDGLDLVVAALTDDSVSAKF